MKKLILLVLALCLVANLAYAEYVSGYQRKDGTYVSGYNRSDRNSTVRDNYSYKVNTNPHTGQVGNNYYRNNPTSAYYGTSGSTSNQTGFMRKSR